MHRAFYIRVLVAALLLPGILLAQKRPPGKNSVIIRGQEQAIYFYPAPADSQSSHPKILFVPGDLGMFGFAVTIAETVAAQGYDVYALDTRRYLNSFTGRSSSLKETEAATDFRAMIDWVDGGVGKKVFLLGWSEGAGLCLLASTSDQAKPRVAGLLTMGMTETNALSWHWTDILPSFGRRDLDAPQFSSAQYLPQVAPVPLFIIQSSHDQYVSIDAAKSLFAAAREPKRFRLIEARDHRFEGNQQELFQAIGEGLQWSRQTSP